MESAPPIFDPESRRYSRLDAIWLTIWLVFLGGLAVLPPRLEWHKQVILLAIGVVQVLEAQIIARFPRRGVFYIILLKISLATLLLDHTAEIGINSSYYPIYYLPVVTAASVLRAVGDIVVDTAGLGSLLFVSLSGDAGI